MKSIKSLTALLLCCLMILTTPVSAIGQTVVNDDPDVNTDIGNVEKSITLEDTTIDVVGVPKDTEVVANAVSKDEYDDSVYEHIDESKDILFAYDISMEKEDGTEWQPEDGETVTVSVDTTSFAVPEGSIVKVLHEHDGELKTIEGEFSVVDNKISFETTGFSKFYFYVSFEYEDLTYSLMGEGSVSLSDLMLNLGIPRNVSSVINVEFSNSEYLDVTKVQNDWILESTGTFGSEEFLTITFDDGKVITIKVTDPVVYNYAVESSDSNKITNLTKLDTKQITMPKVENGDEYSQGKKYVTNNVTITKDNIVKAGQKIAKTGDRYTNTDTDIVIYAKKGMAIGFEAGTDWPTDASRPKHGTNGVWYWSWAGKVNYAVIESDAVAGNQASFVVEAPSGSDIYYCNIVLCVVENSKPNLLSNVIDEINSDTGKDYSIKNVPVTLYNYDGKLWNEYYEAKNAGKYFAFSGSVKGVSSTKNASNRGWTEKNAQVNGGGGVALMGILQSSLVNGLPKMSQGQQVDLFSTNIHSGKEVYSDVGFQFVYNNDTGYYYYNSAINHAQYNSDTNEIELYEQSLAPSDTPNGDSHGNAGFYPFEDISKAYTNTGYKDINWETWSKKLEEQKFELLPSEYSTDIVQTSADNSTAELHYGMQVASDFYLPAGKKIDGKDMVYEFTGDDDLWVFIDGKLVLDIGGGHTHVSGSFNLTTGEVWVEKYTKLATADGGSYTKRETGENLEYIDDFITSLEDDQMHKIQIFYLERHGGVSNCMMRFNLPLVPSDAVNISKNLKNQDSQELSVTPDVEYSFNIYAALDQDDDIVNAKNFEPLGNREYTITGLNAPEGVQRTDSNGGFTLKEGWIASFKDIPRFTEVYVVENEPDDQYVYTGSTVSVNKGEMSQYSYGEPTETKIMQLKESINFDFMNYMKTQPLTVEKEVVGGTAGLIKNYTNPKTAEKFTLSLDFTKDILESGKNAIEAIGTDNSVVKLTDGEAFELEHNQSITIPKVPVNMTFTVNETNPDSTYNSFDNPIIKATTATSTATQPITEYAFGTDYEWKIGDAANAIKVINQQRFDLTISKTGISELDHHEDMGDDFNKEERQSTMYNIVGKRGNEIIVNMNIAIHGNDDTTIKGLPVGSYTVTELTDWSWRYNVEGTAERDVVIPANAEAKIDYKNIRSVENWLSGDSYAENWWGGTGLFSKIINRAIVTTSDN